MPPKKDNDSNNANNNNNNSNTSINASPLKQLNNADVAAAAEQKQALYLANAKLCRLVKRCPWMYDRQHPNYAKKHIMDKSWAKIAKDCDDSIASCKERWRNVRAAFARSINIYKTNSGPNRVKPYYLYNELQFLIKPMMDGRDVGSKEIDEIKSDWDETAQTTQSMQPDAGASSPPVSLSEHTQPEITISDVEAEEFSFPEDEISLIDDAVNSGKITELPQNDTNCTSTSTNVMNSVTNTTEINECQTSGYLSHERTTESSTPMPAKRPKLFHDFSGFLSFNSNDPDAKFLEALLPDMRAMNTRQKIIFKRKIYQSLEEVFETNSDFPAHSARHNQSHAMDGFATRSPDNYPNVTQSIESLRANEMKKLQDFLQNITRQRAAATTADRLPDRNSPRSLGQSCNGQPPLTIIPRCQTRGVTQQQLSVNLNGNNQSNSNFQPIPLKYEFSENED